MPTGQERGEPTVEVVIDTKAKTATVTTRVHPKLKTPTVRMHCSREGLPHQVLIENIHEMSKPELVVTPDSPNVSDVVTVKGICLARAMDEPDRVSEADIRHHVLHMAAIAIRDEMEAIRTPDDHLQKELATVQAKIDRRKALAAK